MGTVGCQTRAMQAGRKFACANLITVWRVCSNDWSYGIFTAPNVPSLRSDGYLSDRIHSSRSKPNTTSSQNRPLTN